MIEDCALYWEWELTSTRGQRDLTAEGLRLPVLEQPNDDLSQIAQLGDLIQCSETARAEGVGPIAHGVAQHIQQRVQVRLRCEVQASAH